MLHAHAAVALPARPRAAAALVPAVTRAMAMLDLLEKERQPISMAGLAERLSLPKSSVHGLCATLVTLGYLSRQDDGGYFIGPRVMGLANAYASRTSPAGEFASLWAGLRTPPQDTMILSVLDGAEVVYVATRPGARPLGLAFTVGMRLPAARSATGKAMLAALDDAELRRRFPQARLPAFPGRPAKRRSELLEEIAQVRERGFAVDDQGIREGVYCFGAAVRDAGGQVVAGVGVCLQKATLGDAVWAQQRDTVLRAARELSRRLGAGVEPVPSNDHKGTR